MKRFLLSIARLLLSFIMYLIVYLLLSEITKPLGFVPGSLIRLALIYGLYRLSKRIIPIPNSYKQSILLTEDDVKTEDNALLSESSPQTKIEEPIKVSFQSVKKDGKKRKSNKTIVFCSLIAVLLAVGVYFFLSKPSSPQNTAATPIPIIYSPIPHSSPKNTVTTSSPIFYTPRPAAYGTDVVSTWGDLFNEYGIVYDTLTPDQQSLIHFPKLDTTRVYYVADGYAYHSVKWCYTLSNTKTFSMSSLKYAVSKGLTPCSKCVDPKQLP